MTSEATMIEAASLANMNQSSVTKPTLCPTDPMADKYPNEVAAFAKPKPTMVAAASFFRCSSIIPPHMEHAYCSVLHRGLPNIVTNIVIFDDLFIRLFVNITDSR